MSVLLARLTVGDVQWVRNSGGPTFQEKSRKRYRCVELPKLGVLTNAEKEELVLRCATESRAPKRLTLADMRRGIARPFTHPLAQGSYTITTYSR